VAQVALQQGRYVGKLIGRILADRPAPPPFRYFDKGSMAVVGKGFAVLQSGRVRLSGFMAWLIWAVIHLEFLAQRNLKFSVGIQWIWTFLTARRGSRLIVNHHGSDHCNVPASFGNGDNHEPQSVASATDPALRLAASHNA
jgi:hypothetical protein